MKRQRDKRKVKARSCKERVRDRTHKIQCERCECVCERERAQLKLHPQHICGSLAAGEEDWGRAEGRKALNSATSATKTAN